MTLHDAIEKLLRIKGKAMSVNEIAKELNDNKWYQKKSGSEICAFQIHGRIINYPNIFERRASTVMLRDGADQSIHINKSKKTSAS